MKNNNAVLNVKSMILCALFTALIAIGAFIRIPTPFVPFTLQFLFTMLAGLLLGKKLGLISVLLYIALGLMGFPIFTEGGGISYVLKPSFGYIIGFAIGAYVTGTMANKESKPTIKRLLLANFTGLFIVYAIGMIYYYIISNYVIGVSIGLMPLFLYCFILTIPSDILLCILAAMLAKKLIPILYGNKSNKHII